MNHHNVPMHERHLTPHQFLVSALVIGLFLIVILGVAFGGSVNEQPRPTNTRAAERETVAEPTETAMPTPTETQTLTPGPTSASGIGIPLPSIRIPPNAGWKK